MFSQLLPIARVIFKTGSTVFGSGVNIHIFPFVQAPQHEVHVYSL